jgi:Na+-driven multidrug efflux pump
VVLEALEALADLADPDPRIIAIGISLLALNLLLQPCKMLNMAMGNALNAIGDTRYTMYTSIVSMSIIGVGCSYWFGISLGWGLTGIYCCMIADEYVRGMLVLMRWRGREVLRQADVLKSDENASIHRGSKRRASLSI